jgi:hypothetical protein
MELRSCTFVKGGKTHFFIKSLISEPLADLISLIDNKNLSIKEVGEISGVDSDKIFDAFNGETFLLEEELKKISEGLK